MAARGRVGTFVDTEAMVTARVCLNQGWEVQSSERVGTDGALLSAAGAPASAEGPESATESATARTWYPTTLPSTVLNTLVQNGVFEDPYEGDNFYKLPGLGPKSDNFTLFPMPDDSPFRASWWYRLEFRVPDELPHEGLFLNFEGVNYRANIWLNGKLIADTTTVRGTYREYEFDVSQTIERDGLNVLAVEIFAPEPEDLANTWVDWNPAPPDKNMGLFREVFLCGSGAVALRNAQVVSRLQGGHARLRVFADAINTTDRTQRCQLRGSIEARSFETEIDLAPGETRRIEFGPGAHSALRIESPRLWWPRVMGAQEMYQLALELSVDGRHSDAQQVDFGIREITSELTEGEHSLFRVNGKPILIRGAGWASDMLLRWDEARERAELDYVKHLNLNTIRFEGPLMRNELLDWCDREGILVIAGWCCCDRWEKWDDWEGHDPEIAVESLRSQVRRTRNHPALISWWYGTDFAPPPEIEKQYLALLEEENWPNPHHSSAANKPTQVTGSSGMKMSGPYDYVPPNYWAEDKTKGGAFGFATEICPGAAVPPIESLRKMLPAENLWPIDDVWNLHAGCKEFGNVEIFTAALTARYGEATDVEDYAQKAQLMTYEAQRAMFEGYGRAKYTATGVVQWMLNNSWPSIIWHVYDYYLRPGGGFFGTRKGCEPLQVQYCYVDRSVSVVSDLPEAQVGLTVQAEVLDFDLREIFNGKASVDVPEDGVTFALQIPNLSQALTISNTYFLRLRLGDASGRSVSENFYWLSKQPDVLEHEKGNWYTTPMSATADFSDLAKLPDVAVSGELRVEMGADGGRASVTLRNEGDHLAFFTRQRLIRNDNGEEVLPTCWDDCYVSLLPGESRELVGEFPAYASGNAGVTLAIDGWNVIPTSVRAKDARDSGAAPRPDAPAGVQSASQNAS